MDTITHAISGAVIGAATALPAREGAGSIRQRALWGGLFAAFPDSDWIMALFMDYIDYLVAHRGITHSILLMPLWAAGLGWVGARLGGLRWREMALLAALALVAHICGDLITSYGTRLFSPVWNAPLAYPITFIIDPIFTGILATGLVVAVWKKRALAAQVSGGVLLCYLGLQAVLYSEARNIAEDYAASANLPEPLVVVFPQPLSPFNWKLVVVAGESYHRSFVNLLADERDRADDDAPIWKRVQAAYRPVDDLYWQEYRRWPDPPLLRDVAITAWQQPEFSGYRKFALLPYVTAVDGDSFSLCVWFSDLRFTLPELDHPFEYAMCREEGRDWTLRLEEREAG